MRVLIATIGTRGDVQPYIALAKALEETGFETTLATHPVMRSLVESYGVRFAPIGPDIDIAHETAVIRAKSPNWIVGFNRVMKFSFSMLEKAHPDLLALCQKTDLVIVTHTAAGSIEADQLNLPKISVTIFPQAIPVNDSNEPFIKRLIGKMAGAGMGLMMTRPIDQIRKRAGVPPMGPEGITSKALNLVAISPHVIPPDPRWEPRHQMTGYWFAPSPQTWTATQNLLDFLDGGDAPVVISLGAMAISGEDALEAAQITLQAVQEAGVRAIIQGWDEPMRQLTFPSKVFHAGSVPHDWLLVRSSALVHHGGFGTTAAGLRAGIPAIVIPHIIDQFIWGGRIFELGVGPKPIDRSKLTVQNLAEALRQVTGDAEMRSKAADLGENIRAENGLQIAVDLIRKTISESK